MKDVENLGLGHEPRSRASDGGGGIMFYFLALNLRSFG